MKMELIKLNPYFIKIRNCLHASSTLLSKPTYRRRYTNILFENTQIFRLSIIYSQMIQESSILPSFMQVYFSC